MSPRIVTEEEKRQLCVEYLLYGIVVDTLLSIFGCFSSSPAAFNYGTGSLLGIGQVWWPVMKIVNSE